MPGQSDESLPNRHLLLSGGSGAGKTTFAKQWYKSHARVLLWDPDGSHKARGMTYTSDISEFIRKMAVGVRAKKCRLGFEPEHPDEELYDKYCHAIWQVIDCRYPLTQVTEELQECTGSGQARGFHNSLLMRSRKFALTNCYISQRPQQIDKSTLAQTPHKVTGQLDRGLDIEAMAKEMDVHRNAISGLIEANGPEPRKKLFFIERLPGYRAKEVSIALPARQKRRPDVAK